MHPALKRLVDANEELQRAERALDAAQERRRQAARELAQIEDREERTQAALHAYSEFGKGLSLALAEAVTGLPGRHGQSAFLVLAGRMKYQPKGRQIPNILSEREPVTGWRKPDEFESEVVRTHIAHGQDYWIDEGLGWQRLMTPLTPAQAADYLIDPTAAVAESLSLTREAFIEYLSTGGSVRCQGHNKDGTRCKSRVAGRTGQLKADVWKIAVERGGYCRRHGGDPEYDPRRLRAPHAHSARG
ncbi:hypothetical protein [Phenylobacterium sp.]|uniref:hypothetical protein n=1 Tax=Phenylobacterium sp. TaxID=1871053 RepID=UPI00272F70D6|nr:hypothetical protein [Phenylobacterium sp.]MDP1618455.1 hypothetical protein [Phenylobacterium sp.]MDP1988052.1 hypothetical protein [Phenylobacterium sp.]